MVTVLRCCARPFKLLKKKVIHPYTYHTVKSMASMDKQALGRPVKYGAGVDDICMLHEAPGSFTVYSKI